MRRTRQLLYDRNTLKLELLTTPIYRLGLTIEGAFLETAIHTVRKEMRRVGLTRIEPVFYLSDGYGCIEGTTNISLGFYDCSPLLQELHHEYRGWRHTEKDILHLVRHEVGHAFCYAYKLYRLPEFRAIFKVKGNFFRTYPATDRYHPNPWSKDYVNPSGDHYAQKHPDDDFAETFAVWLTPRANWRARYRSRPGALRKLGFVERMVKQHRRQAPRIENDPEEIVAPVEELTITLAQLYRARTTRYRRRASGFLDPDLKELFDSVSPRASRQRRNQYVSAARFLREHQRTLIAQVSHWVGVDTVVAQDLLIKCRSRAEALDLRVPKKKQAQTLTAVTAYLSTLCSNYAETEKYLPQVKD